MRKILSWNINVFNAKENGDIITRSENILKTIRSHSPDILVLQEASDYFIDLLSDYTEHTRTRSHGGIVAILSKKDIIINNTKKYSDYATSIYLDNIIIVNCHLCPHVRNQKIRDSQFSTFPKENCIIIGDMNMNRNQNFCYDNMKDIALQFSNSKDTWFYSYFENGSSVSRRYDRVYSDLEIKSFDVTGYRNESDHMPILITY
tara:strand:- start:354 stop:965 length:612 start_codon:yes stop_codon:yes gene_type:complete